MIKIIIGLGRAIIKLPIIIFKYISAGVRQIAVQTIMLIKHPIKRSQFLWRSFRKWLKWHMQNGDNILVAQGVHSIVGLMGGGKTLLSNMIVQDMLPPNRFVYVIDKALSSALDDGRAVYADIFACFKDGSQIYRLPTKIQNRRVFGVILDEITLAFNRRNNKYGNYNDKFLGLIELIIALRHQGIRRIWILSQSYDNLDVQLMRLNKYKHLIYSKRGYNYDAFLDTRKMLVLPRSLKIVSQVRNDFGEYVSILAQVLAVDYRRHITTYDHRALSDKYNSLPELVIRTPSAENKSDPKK